MGKRSRARKALNATPSVVPTTTATTPTAPHEECMIGVYYTTYRAGDPSPNNTHTIRRGTVHADLGLDKIPDPPFTDREMQDIMFATKMAALRCLRLRRKNETAQETATSRGRGGAAATDVSASPTRRKP